jgi:hypothetical protein
MGRGAEEFVNAHSGEIEPPLHCHARAGRGHARDLFRASAKRDVGGRDKPSYDSGKRFNMTRPAGK